LAALSKQAHIDHANPKLMAKIDNELDNAYLALLKTPSITPAIEKSRKNKATV
jgi:hypothetical protein